MALIPLLIGLSVFQTPEQCTFYNNKLAVNVSTVNNQATLRFYNYATRQQNSSRPVIFSSAQSVSAVTAFECDQTEFIMVKDRDVLLIHVKPYKFLHYRLEFDLIRYNVFNKMLYVKNKHKIQVFYPHKFISQIENDLHPEILYEYIVTNEVQDFQFANNTIIFYSEGNFFAQQLQENYIQGRGGMVTLIVEILIMVHVILLSIYVAWKKKITIRTPFSVRSRHRVLVSSNV